MIGATADAILIAEDRRRFDIAMKKLVSTPRVPVSRTLVEEARGCRQRGLPRASSVRPYHGRHRRRYRWLNREESPKKSANGSDLSPTNELLIDESLIGWKEYEMEVCDKTTIRIIVCSIEN